MYSYIKGTLEEILQDSVTVECGGIGYSIFASSSFTSSARQGDEVKLYLYQVVREDEISLYGFSSNEEKSMFVRLLTVSGIGPKSALAMLNTIGARNIAVAIVTGDAKSLTKAAGVGMKTAQRLILELRGSIENEDFLPGAQTVQTAQDSNVAQEAVTAIMALGFTRAEAVKSIGAVEPSESVEDIIRRVLVSMGSGKG